MDATGMDCSLSTNVIKNWWGVLTILYFVLFLYSFSIVVEFYRKGKSIKKILNSNLQLVIVMAAFDAFLRVIEGVLRYTSGGMVGDHVMITVIHALAGWLFWGELAGKFMKQWIQMIINNGKIQVTKNMPTS